MKNYVLNWENVPIENIFETIGKIQKYFKLMLL